MTSPGPLAAESDEALFARYAGEDDQGAFNILHARYAPRISGFLARRLKDEARVEDLTQDTFLRIHRARRSYDPGRKFSTWIHTIANNLLKNEFRNRSRHGERLFSDLRPEAQADGGHSRVVEFAGGGPDPEEQTYRGELRVAIDSAISRMDDHHRVPFVLREIDDRTYEEIADVIGIPVGTVKSRLNRAKTAFADLYRLPAPAAPSAPRGRVPDRPARGRSPLPASARGITQSA